MGRALNYILIFVFLITLLAGGVKMVYAEAAGQGIYFFYSEECEVCHQELQKLEEIAEKDAGFYIRTYEIGKDSQNLEILFYLLEQYGMEDFDFSIPIVFIGESVLAGRGGISRGLGNALDEASRLQYDPAARLIDAYSQNGLLESPYITLPAVVISALIDSVNPCAIAIILFMLSTMVLSRDKKRTLAYGLIYAGTIFAVYLGLGFGIIYFLDSLRISPLFLVAVGAVLVIAGAVSIKDYFWQGKGPSLGIPSPVKKVIERNIQKATILSMVFIGLVISIFEATCSGAIYLGLLSMIATRGLGLRLTAMLLLYNLIFVLPLLVILAVFYFGFPVKKLNRWLIQKRRKTYRLIAGIVLIFLGVYLVIYFLTKL
ncbi:MAG: cytochrome c biogenesis CcdA family protein [Actinomycetota bacterium]